MMTMPTHAPTPVPPVLKINNSTLRRINAYLSHSKAAEGLHRDAVAAASLADTAAEELAPYEAAVSAAATAWVEARRDIPAKIKASADERFRKYELWELKRAELSDIVSLAKPFNDPFWRPTDAYSKLVAEIAELLHGFSEGLEAARAKADEGLGIVKAHVQAVKYSAGADARSCEGALRHAQGEASRPLGRLLGRRMHASKKN